MFQADFDHAGPYLSRLRQGVRAQRMRLMLIVSSICAFALVGVAATVLSALF